MHGEVAACTGRNRPMPTTLLLVEARDDSRSPHAAALRAAGLRVIRVCDSHAALEALKTVLPSVVVAALNPRTRDDHLAVCREIRSDSRTRQIPILLTTERMTEQDVALATDPGALVLTATQQDGAKLVAAVHGVVAVQRAEPLKTSLHRDTSSKQSA
jgi:CheY-like chemotaxis protein